MALLSSLRHSSFTKFARSALHWAHRVRHRDGKPLRCVVAPGLEFQIYPKGELSEFLSLGPLFERTEMRLVASLLRPGMKVIDAGANIGLYSLLAAKRIGNSGQIWSFEPSQDTYSLFLENLALNGVTTVSAHRLALSDAAGELVLRAESGFGDLYRHLDYTGKAAAGDKCEKVTVSTLDDFSTARGITAIDFLKIDIEGAEFFLLQGARHLLSQSPDVIVMFESEEDWCLRSGCKTEDALNLLRGLGFGLYSWSKRQKRWSAIEDAPSTSRTVWAVRNPDLLNAPTNS
jgi:FkbM family methyltransferase